MKSDSNKLLRPSLFFCNIFTLYFLRWYRQGIETSFLYDGKVMKYTVIQPKYWFWYYKQ